MKPRHRFYVALVSASEIADALGLKSIRDMIMAAVVGKAVEKPLVKLKMRQIEEHRRRVGPDGWTCHVCRDYRPDALIGVYSRTKVFPGTKIAFTENVRYCLDREPCVVGAKSVTWVGA